MTPPQLRSPATASPTPESPCHTRKSGTRTVLAESFCVPFLSYATCLNGASTQTPLRSRSPTFLFIGSHSFPPIGCLFDEGFLFILVGVKLESYSIRK